MNVLCVVFEEVGGVGLLSADAERRRAQNLRRRPQRHSRSYSLLFLNSLFYGLDYLFFLIVNSTTFPVVVDSLKLHFTL